jgi:hypothetical protein
VLQNAPQIAKTFDIDQTQEIGSMTQDLDLSPISSLDSSGNPSQGSSINAAIRDLPSSGAPVSSVTSAPQSEGGGINIQMLQDMAITNAAAMDDTEMLGGAIPRPLTSVLKSFKI